MAKNMARLNGNAVINIEWQSSDTKESETLKDINDRVVCVGDTYENGKWYRDGAEVLTPLEEAQKRIEELEAQTADQAAALEAIYMGVVS